MTGVSSDLIRGVTNVAKPSNLQNTQNQPNDALNNVHKNTTKKNMELNKLFGCSGILLEFAIHVHDVGFTELGVFKHNR